MELSKAVFASGLSMGEDGASVSASSYSQPADLEDVEAQAINDLRLRLQVEAGLRDLPDDLLHCCCRVAGYSASLSFQRARDMFEWREREGLDSILTDPGALAAERFWGPLLHWGLPGRDRKSRPVMIQAVGRWDMKALSVAMRDRKSTLIRSHMLIYETLRRQALEVLALRAAAEQAAGGVAPRGAEGAAAAPWGGRRRPRPVRWVIVLDVGGLSLWHTRYPEVLACFKEASKMGSRYYPETVDRMFVVNASSSFHIIWRFLSHFIKPNTRAKVRVLPEGDFRELVAECGAACLPVQLGGLLPADALPHVAASDCGALPPSVQEKP